MGDKSSFEIVEGRGRLRRYCGEGRPPENSPE
jgi:hypothetical protein